MDQLATLVSKESRFKLIPKAFFVTWYGVIRLTYTGFPETVHQLKRSLENHFAALDPENPGSRWPGTTLGSLRDDKSLTYPDLEVLHQICARWTRRVAESPWVLHVDRLQYVLFGCRSLEKRLISVDLPLDGESSEIDCIPRQHQKRIDAIHDWFTPAMLQDYWPQVSRYGHRESHYRTPLTEGTLIVDMPVENQPPYLDPFIAEVEENLPGKYVWFNPDSRHITLRSMEFSSELS